MIIPIGQQFQMLLQMDLHVDRMVKVDIVSAVASLGVAIGAALMGAGPPPRLRLPDTRHRYLRALCRAGAGATTGRSCGCDVLIWTATSALACTKWASGW